MINTGQQHGFGIFGKQGKGSHVKMRHPDGRVLIIPRNEKSLKPGTLGNILKTLGDFKLRQLPDVLNGRLMPGAPNDLTLIRR